MGCLCETAQRHGFFTWAVVWSCRTCNVNFHCCDRTCGPKNRQRTPYAAHEQLLRHHRRSHKKQRVEAVAVDDHQPSDAFDADELPRYAIPTDAFNIFLGHVPTKRFFEDVQNHSFGAAVQGLVARSCYLDSPSESNEIRSPHVPRGFLPGATWGARTHAQQGI